MDNQTHLVTTNCTAWNVIVDRRPGKPPLKTDGTPSSSPRELRKDQPVKRIDVALEAGPLSTSFVEVADGTVYEIRDVLLRTV